MSYLMVTASEISRCSDELRNLNSRFKSETEVLRNSEQSLNSMWEGQANTAFHNSFIRDVERFDSFYSAIEMYIQALSIIVQKYEEAENRNTNTAMNRNY